MRIHREIERAKPIFKAINRLTGWYQAHPLTPIVKAEVIARMHEIMDKHQVIVKRRQAEDIMPLLQELSGLNERMNKLRTQIKNLGPVHQTENESMAILLATTELNLLMDKISDIPQAILDIENQNASIEVTPEELEELHEANAAISADAPEAPKFNKPVDK